MKVEIFVQTPNPSHNWGDTLFARSLAAEIKNLGNEVRLRFREDWEREGSADVEVLLAGHYKRLPRKGRLSLLWVIYGHSVWSEAELGAFDKVYVASGEKAREWGALGINCERLEQAADNFLMGKRVAEQKDIDVLFIGSNYDLEGVYPRRVARDLGKLVGGEKRVFVVGTWKGVLPDSWIIGDWVGVEEAFGLYSRARVVLGDHLPSMGEAGFVSNRVYDLAEIGAFQMQPRMRALERLGVVTYSGDDFLEKLWNYIENEVERERSVEEVRRKCSPTGFKDRAKRLLK